MSESVLFKSTSEFFNKELSGIKNNTVRKSDNCERFKILKEFSDGKINSLIIIIYNEEQTYRAFSRQVKDVSIYEDLYIITWEV